MFRLVFWICLLVMFIPTNGTREDSALSQATAAETLSAAQSIYHDILGFCHRNPQTCETGEYMVSKIELKARVGAGMIMDYLEENRISSNIDPVETSSISQE